MKKFFCMLLVILSMSFCYAQRPSSSGASRGGSHPTSISSSRSSVSHSSSRSSSSISRSNSSHSASRQNSSSFSPSTRSNHPSVSTPSTHRPITASPTQTPRPENGPTNFKPQGPHNHSVPGGMHPMPPMYHPMDHHPVHMHYHPIPCWRPIDYYWLGYWEYVHYHPYNDVVIYVENTYRNQEVIYLTTDENYIYTIIRDRYEGQSYFLISDQSDHVLVKTPVNRKYQTITLENGGVWLMKTNGKDPLYFMYDGSNLYRYESD